jgi:hypothetical protein
MAASLSLAAWSWIGAGLAIIGVWLGGRSPRVGWVYGISAQAFWVLYGAFTAQPGMILQSCVFVAIYVSHLRRWRGTRFHPARRVHHPDPSERSGPVRVPSALAA